MKNKTQMHFIKVRKKTNKHFWISSILFQVILILYISSAAFTFHIYLQEKWIPDYENRDEWQQPEKIMDAIGVKPGMTIADVGAGKGYFTFKLAERVGPEGVVYATDIKEGPLEYIEKHKQEEGLENIITILGEEDDPGLPKGKIDIILMVHVLHIVIHEQNPVTLLNKLKKNLKPGGILVLVHWDGIKMGHPDVYAYSKESVMNVIDKSSFELVRIETFLPRETIFILR